MIAIVEYGLGNIQAFVNIYRRLGIAVTSARNADDLRRARKIILPGVGAFDWAMQRLHASGMRDALDDMVLNAKVDVLGVCVGMQIMAKRSEEGRLPGLGWVNGEVERFRASKSDQEMQLPHMGWNTAVPTNLDDLFRNIYHPRFYFLHSYHVVTASENNVLATTRYGGCFTSALQSDNIRGTQFHPEKSHASGVTLLRNFAEL